MDVYHDRFKPPKPTQLGGLATHHILDEELELCRPSAAFQLPDGAEYLIGHNVDYDWSAIGEPDIKRICTCAISRMLWPEADSHSQSAMIYLLERKNARTMLRNAHSAADDVRNCLVLLMHIVEKLGRVASWEELWEVSERARIPTHMPVGKHKGMAIADLPRDYIGWFLRQPDVDPYLEKALRGEA